MVGGYAANPDGFKKSAAGMGWVLFGDVRGPETQETVRTDPDATNEMAVYAGGSDRGWWMNGEGTPMAVSASPLNGAQRDVYIGDTRINNSGRHLVSTPMTVRREAVCMRRTRNGMRRPN
ncbi:hypothetical protein J2S70_000454 [Trueperella bonasi]|uniref:Uncharacterized protein n=1 Tax=Trueperella bonasi TaxID=312286 RepID=A0ABT9NF95_9ACTO|nr:hypothetical protein [Trueperella bonasi]MDP9805872.1 hypothetical protein [Trueperella bonasi]